MGRRVGAAAQSLMLLAAVSRADRRPSLGATPRTRDKGKRGGLVGLSFLPLDYLRSVPHPGLAPDTPSTILKLVYLVAREELWFSGKNAVGRRQPEAPSNRIPQIRSSRPPSGESRRRQSIFTNQDTRRQKVPTAGLDKSQVCVNCNQFESPTTRNSLPNKVPPYKDEATSLLLSRGRVQLDSALSPTLGSIIPEPQLLLQISNKRVNTTGEPTASFSFTALSRNVPPHLS
ncbi:hypothetical protein O988_07721 [Pseudogymnoascus sp. VKM F-3808]|nr:hypothetical protein O988_07721 [Pseudogymnoascus sp. VKM F-3808]